MTVVYEALLLWLWTYCVVCWGCAAVLVLPRTVPNVEGAVLGRWDDSLPKWTMADFGKRLSYLEKLGQSPDWLYPFDFIVFAPSHVCFWICYV